MKDFQLHLLAHAGSSFPASEYNRIHYEAVAPRQDEEGLPVSPPLFYELVLDASVSWEAFREEVIPRFFRYLQGKRVEPATPRAVVLALFHGDQCSLVAGPVLIELLQEAEGLDAAGLRRWIRGCLEEPEAPSACSPTLPMVLA